MNEEEGGVIFLFYKLYIVRLFAPLHFSLGGIIRVQKNCDFIKKNIFSIISIAIFDFLLLAIALDFRC